MKSILLFFILFCAITLPAFGELTATDLDKIRSLVKEEIQGELVPIKTDIASMKADIVTLKEDVAWLRGRFEGVDKQFESVDQRFVGIQNQIVGIQNQIRHVTNITYALVVLIVAAIAIPQIIIAWRNARDTDQQTVNKELRQEITDQQAVNKELRQEIEALKQQRM